MDPFYIKRGDRLPYLEATLSDEGGSLTTLAGATVHFVMRKKGDTTATVRGLATIVNAAARTVRYEWAAGDTGVTGLYRAEFEVNFGGRPWTFPNPGFIPVNVVDDQG